MFIATESSHHDCQHNRRQWPDEWNELQQCCNTCQQQGIRHTQQPEGNAVADQRCQGQQQQRTHIAGQQNVQVFGDGCPQGAVRFRHPRQDIDADAGRFLDQQKAQHRDQHHINQVTCGMHDAQANPLCPRQRIVGAALQLGAYQPQQTLARRLQNFWQGKLRRIVRGVEQIRQFLTQPGGLIDHARAEHAASHEQHRDHDHEHQRDRRRTRQARRTSPLDQLDQRVHQITEENCKHHHQQRTARCIQEKQQQRDDKDGPDDAGNTNVKSKHADSLAEERQSRGSTRYRIERSPHSIVIQPVQFGNPRLSSVLQRRPRQLLYSIFLNGISVLCTASSHIPNTPFRILL